MRKALSSASRCLRKPPPISCRARVWRLRARSWSAYATSVGRNPNHSPKGYCVASGVTSFGRQHPDMDPDLVQRLFVFGVDVAAEDQLRVGRAMQPAIFL